MSTRTEKASPKLAPIGIRTTPERKARLEAQARAKGRSLANEVERLLDFAMDYEERMGGAELLQAMEKLAQTVRHALEASEYGLDERRGRARAVATIQHAASWVIPIELLNEGDKFRILQDLSAELASFIQLSNIKIDVNPIMNLTSPQKMGSEWLDYYCREFERWIGLNEGSSEFREEVLNLKEKLFEAERLATEISDEIQKEMHTARWHATSAFLTISKRIHESSEP